MPLYMARNVSVGDGSSTGIDDLLPDREIPERDQPDHAEYRQERIESAFHPLRTSRWNTSRQCALIATNPGSDSVASVRGRGASKRA